MGLADRVVRLRLPSGGAAVIAGPDHFAVLQALDEHHGLRGYEPESFACALTCLRAQPGALYDVGANIGAFSIVAAGVLGTECIAFEPTPDLADVAENAARANGLPIEVRRMALSDHSGRVRLFLSPKADTSNSLNGNFRPGGQSIDVEASTLDAQATKPAALLKIDVETAEPHVLRGAVQTIKTQRPYMIVEVLRPAIAAQINEIMAGLGYRFYRLKKGGRLGRSRMTLPSGVSNKDRNWLFAPQPIGIAFRLRLWLWCLRIAAT